LTEQASFFRAARPSFARIRANEGRVAVIDVGSNSVRLVVFEGATRSPAYFFNEKMACGLGAEIARTGRLAPEGRALALATLRRFSALAERMKVAALDAVATAAVREAEDGREFRDQVERETGLRLRVIEGDEEARLSALGVLLGEPQAEGVAADMGGASMELAQLSDGDVGPRITLGLGPQRLAGLSGGALRKRIDAEVERGAAVVDCEGRTLFVVGGSWRAVAKAQMARAGHPLQVLQGYRMDAQTAIEACDWIAAQPPEKLREAGVSSGRAPVAPVAAQVLARLVDRLKPEAVSVSAFGLREGVYYERLPAAMRARDPLIETAKVLEQSQARFPGFGEEIAAWVAPLTVEWPAEERRLARAACLLNDVNWRAHPDYRAVSCFETVTRANLAAVDHAGRVWMGLALMLRYGGKPNGGMDAALKLLTPESATRARALGRALRLGAMLSGSTPGALADARLSVDAAAVSLRLTGDSAVLSGELVARRLKSLADAMGLTALLDA
jgi:exopolyphosphatase/guanosine-5'-triphosphate,3'-diphosphate pyrophosphatase